MTAITLPSELLIEVCSYLPPSDLYSLSSVCKRYRTILWSSKSATTQAIWRTSRRKFAPYLISPPPNDMSEQQYIWMMVLLQKCMFCDETDKKKLTMYFEFRMYCCIRCLAQRTISKDTLIKEWEVPTDLLECMQSLSPNALHPQLFLMKQMKRTLYDFSLIRKDEDKMAWIKERREKVSKLQPIFREYNTQHDNGKYNYKERLERLFRTLNMSTEYPYRRNMSFLDY